MNKIIKISIRNLVEFIMRHGSIDNRYTSSIKAIEGIRGHQRVQKSYGDNYTAEVPLKYTLTYEDLEIMVEGRADGILIEDDKTIIDEIKTTTKDLLLIDENTNPLHWAQAKCYGYIYSMQNELENIDIQITYYNIDTKSTRILRQSYTLKELEEFFFWLIDEYKTWAQLESDWVNKRNESIKKLKFPFENYRPGQRELAVRVYKSITDSKKCFTQAPTGTGKTISTLFPAIKAMGEDKTSKIFYLTAKTITREVAQNTISLMRKKDLKLKAVTITAKEKICKMEEVNCNPEYCPYANGYFDRINNSLKDILAKYNDYSKENIEKISEINTTKDNFISSINTKVDNKISDYFYRLDKDKLLQRFYSQRETELKQLLLQQVKLSETLKNKKITLTNAKNKISEALFNNLSIDMIQILTESVNELQTDITNIENELIILNNKITNQKEQEKKEIQISDQLLDFKYLYSHATQQEKKILIKTIVDKIIVTGWHDIEIIYKY